MLTALLFACTPSPTPTEERGGRLPAPALASTADPFEPIPASLDLDPRLVTLGGRLFADPALSGSGTRACTDCHVLEKGGIYPEDARPSHPDDGTGLYNVPTVFNVAFNFRLNWQGGKETLEEHFRAVLLNPRVMDGGSWEAVEARLSSYDADFVAAGFPSGVTAAGIEAAVVSYERSLLTPNAPFDRWLRGETEIPEPARRGYAHFKDLGCVSCHQGINVGGNLFQRFGIQADPFADRGATTRDHGRALLTGLPEDEFVFRVPSLRNVAVTAPYFHDGSAPSLPMAVREMGRVQLGYGLADDEVADIVAFLESLTGEWAGQSLAVLAAPAP